MHIGSSVSATLMYVLSWILLGVGGLMVVLAVGAFFGLVSLPISVQTDLIGAAVFFAIALLCRLMARRFEQVAT